MIGPLHRLREFTIGIFRDLVVLFRDPPVGYARPVFVQPVPCPEPAVVPVVVREAPLEPVEPVRSVTVRPARPKPADVPSRRRTAELKADVLDQLEGYQVYIKRLKKADPEAYRTYRRVGAFIPPKDMLADGRELEPGVVGRLPAFGAVVFGTADDRTRTIAPDGSPNVPIRFTWMTKLEHPGHDIERRNNVGGVVYRCTSYFDDAKDRKIKKLGRGVCTDYAVHVADDGTVTALRVLRIETQVIRHKRGANRGGTTTLRHLRWRYAPVAGYHYLKNGVTMEEMTKRIFCFTMNFWVQSATQSMIRVTASKDNIVMPFVVDVLDTPSFFADRDVTIGPEGGKKRIFHVVRPHVRESGAKVRMHFRGLRDFTWNGYQVRIVVPGRDAHDVAEMTWGSFEEIPESQWHGMVPMDDAADMIANALHSPGEPEDPVAFARMMEEGRAAA